MASVLDTILASVKKNLLDGYYSVSPLQRPRRSSLSQSIKRCWRNAVIAELKFSSPAHGFLRDEEDPASLVRQFEEGGAVGASIVTEKDHFRGSVESFRLVSEHTSLPLIMKDFVISKTQIDAARNLGADAILFIASLFREEKCEAGVDEMLRYARKSGLEVLLETHDEEEYRWALGTDVDLVGINNRDLKTMKMDLSTTERILGSVGSRGRVVVSESGIESAADIRRLKVCGVSAFLVGASIMRAADVSAKLKELVEA